jgi:hypothetical protein
MGGGSSSSFSSSDMSKLQLAAEQRLKAIASKSSKILFACEKVDRSSLEARIANTPIFQGARVTIVDSSEATSVDQKVEQASILVVYTDTANGTKFLDAVIDQALLRKIAGVHVRVRPDAQIPSKVTAYRWRSLSWNELTALFE